MTIAIPPMPVDAAPPVFRQSRPVTVEEYHRLIEAGAFAHDERYELIEGWITPKTSRNPPHDVSLELTQLAIRGRLGPHLSVRTQSAITVADSEPEPDIAVARGSVRAYAQRHPTAADVTLVVEIASSSLTDDRSTKLRIYAHGLIPVYWIVNLRDRVVEVYTNPSLINHSPVYLDRTDHAEGAEIPLVIDGQTLATIPVAELLP